MNEYNNTLDLWYHDCHWAIQEVLRWPYEKASEGIRWVTGDPNKVAGQAPAYESMAGEVERAASEVQRLTASIQGWEGETNANFLSTMERIQTQTANLAPAIRQTTEILHAAAETSVEAANMILGIIKGVIEFLVTSLAISAALAAFTFGASFAAWIAANMAKGAAALARIMSGLTRVASVLNRIASALQRVAQIMKKVAEVLKLIKEIMQALKEAVKGAKLISKEKLVLTGIQSLARLPIKGAAWGPLAGVDAVTGADIDMPGPVGSLGRAGMSGGRAVGSSNDAVDAATGVDGY